MKQKRYVEMTRQEWRLATEGLNYELVGDHFTEGRRKAGAVKIYAQIYLQAPAE